MRDQIEVDENASAPSERNMVTFGLNVKAHTHGSLNMPLLSVIRLLVELRSDTFLSVIVFKTEHHRCLVPGVKHLRVQDHCLILQDIGAYPQELGISDWLNRTADSVLTLDSFQVI